MIRPPRPQFLALDSVATMGRRFMVLHEPAGALRGLVVYVHPFAEEMNKARRMAALQSRALARAGFAVLQMDLMGCGDSDGDFGDASWQRWVQDVMEAAQWLRTSTLGADATTPLWMWGLRAGALLAAEAARTIEGPLNFLLWQPTLRGRLLLQQFLRLHAAAGMLAGETGHATRTLRKALAEGQAVEIAGYRLAPAMCSGLERAELSPPREVRPGRLVWFEVGGGDTGPAPAAAEGAAAWAASGWTVEQRVVAGASFWQTVEIEEIPELLNASTAALCSNGDPTTDRGPCHRDDAPGA